MSVRRLAEAAVQPPAFAFNGDNAGWALDAIKKYPKGREQSAVIPLMMRAQEQEGWVTKAAIETIADMLGMPYIRALEVATFYTQFQLKPVGSRAHVQVCGTTPCMLRGSEALMDVCRSKIHHDQFHTNDQGTLSWEEVECLGACVNAPMVMIFKDAFEDLTPERLAEIIDQFEAGKGASVKPGPQDGRSSSEPIAGLTTLRDEKSILKSTRDREAAEAARAAKASAAEVPPSNAGKPASDAAETSTTVKSPSPKKAAPAAEASSPAPAFDKKAADRAEPAVEGVAKPRTRTKTAPAEAAPIVAPEMLKGRPAGPAAKRTESETVAPAGAPSLQVPLKMETAKAPAAEKPGLNSADRPAGMEKPANPDDLKLISGVGPKIEGILHTLGIFTFAQVASWNDAERAWVDSYLNFRDRIDRDNWVGQAKALADGGVAEYVRVFGKKPV